jgi:isopentenyl-diphosphate Delta-isomerase
MKNELCFNVDSNDNILGTLSKYNSHRIDPFTSLSPLHRAFSVFILSPDTSQLLLQQRSEHKITFPLLWANTCCSHPIAGLGEDTDDVVTGIVKAAHRKLYHELGIPSEIVNNQRAFYNPNPSPLHS